MCHLSFLPEPLDKKASGRRHLVRGEGQKKRQEKQKKTDRNPIKLKVEQPDDCNDSHAPVYLLRMRRELTRISILKLSQPDD